MKKCRGKMVSRNDALEGREMNKNRVSIPKEVDGCAVEQSGDPMEHRGQKWQTLVPTDYENDGRIWEFSMTTGRIICTVSA